MARFRFSRVNVSDAASSVCAHVYATAKAADSTGIQSANVRGEQRCPQRCPAGTAAPTPTRGHRDNGTLMGDWAGLQWLIESGACDVITRAFTQKQRRALEAKRGPRVNNGGH